MRNKWSGGPVSTAYGDTWGIVYMRKTRTHAYMNGQDAYQWFIARKRDERLVGPRMCGGYFTWWQGIAPYMSFHIRKQRKRHLP